MNTRILSLAVVFCLLLMACESENVQLKEEVIAIHDEVMPHMGKLKSLQKELNEKADQLALDDSVEHREQILELRNTSSELDNAYEGMFVWMRQFQPEQEGMTEEEFNDYLNEQKASVEKVKTDINQALEKAEELK